MAKQVKALKLNDSVALEADMGSKLNQSAAAPEFDSTEDYPAGYHVTHEGNLYRFTSDHSAGAWTGNDVVLEDMTTPDAMLDITAAGFLRVVAADGTIMWAQNTLSASRTEIASVFSQSTAYSPLDLVVYNNVLYKCTAAHAAGAWDASHFALATVDDILKAMRAQEAADVSRLEGEISPLQFAAWYPDGSVTSASQFTSGVKFDAANKDTTNKTISVLPFKNTGTAANDNSDLVGRVVIPPYWDDPSTGDRYTVTGIASAADSGDANSNLTAIVAPSTITSIGDMAFMDCSSLASVYFPAVSTIGEVAFCSCTSLASISLPSLTSLGNSAFESCTSLASAFLPVAESIGGMAFANCASLVSISLPAATSMGDDAFNGCTSLVTASAPNLTGVSVSAFYGCSSLESVSFPSATVISDSAFDGCSSLASVSLPSATTISPFAFGSCAALEKIYLPAATTIDEEAFDSCTALVSVSLPSATSLEAYAFYDGASLDSVNFGPNARTNVPTLGTDVFDGVPTTCKIIVPNDNYTAWTTASGWSDLVSAGYRFIRYSEWEVARKYELAEKAPLASPAFTGTPTAPTPTAGDSSTKIATTAFVSGAMTPIDARLDSIEAQVPPCTADALAAILGITVTSTTTMDALRTHFNLPETATLQDVLTAAGFGDPAFADRNHTHPVSDITGLSDALNYSIVTPATTTSGTTVSATLQNKAMNNISLASTVTQLNLTLPAQVSGKARDLFIRLVVTGSTAPEISFAGSPTFDTDDDEWASIEPGVNLIMLTETNQS